MDEVLKKLLCAAGISGYEHEVAAIMKKELAKSCDEVSTDTFGNVIARKGKGGRKIMIAAHMDEVGFIIKHVTPGGYLHFVKVGGIDDRALPGQRVLIKSARGDVHGIIGAKPPHIQKDEERNKPVKSEDMFIDIGASSREEALKRVEITDMAVFEPNAGRLDGNLYYGKSLDNRLGCYALLKMMERLKIRAEVYAVATTQEEVGLKGARTSSFRVNPDFALVVDTTVAGDTPHIQEHQSSIKLGAGVSIGTVEAGGRGFIVSSGIKELFIGSARANKIKYQLDVLEGGMTDAAIIYMNREGVLSGVLGIPTRYVHSASGVFSMDDVDAAVSLGVKALEAFVKK
jgi:endoglucanase